MVLIQATWLGTDNPENWAVAQKNLLLPSAVFGTILGVTIFSRYITRTPLQHLIPMVVIAITALDLLRFGNKFLPFTPQEYLFPATKTTTFLEKQQQPFRILSLNSEILPPNFSTMYKVQSVEGYDPLYTEWYGQYISVLERGEGKTDSMIRFNRMILPRRITEDQLHFMNVEYILSSADSVPENLVKVAEEGRTKIHKNTAAYPRVFFATHVYSYTSDEQQREALVSHNFSTDAIVGPELQTSTFASGSARIIRYDMNRVEIETELEGEGYLVFSDSYYPTWIATIDGRETPIYRTNYAFRGVRVPAGKRVVIFQNKLFGF
jgi:hypothetical protein